MLLGKKILGSISYLGGIMVVPEPFLHAWQQMIEYNNEYFLEPGQTINYDRATVSYHSFARNSLVDQMKGDWLLQLDCDIIFDPDTLARMLNKMNKHGIDVMVAPYLYKAEPNPVMLYGYNPKTKAKYIVGDWDKTADLVRIKGAGGGCLLVRRKVFDKIRTKLKCSPFDIYWDGNSPMSEDHSFFERCWKLKIPVYFSPDITVRHLKYRELDVNKDYDRSKVDISKDRIELGGFGLKKIH